MKKAKQMKSLSSSLMALMVGCIFLTALPVHADTFNVKDYGAVGDDKTDNTAAFSSCIQAVIKAGDNNINIPLD